MLKPQIPQEGWAEVRARDRVMRYSRAGTGPTVLVLAHADEPLRRLLLEALAPHFRSLVPDLPPTEANVATWLSHFLEGLGATMVSVVATGSYCIPALELALRGGEHCARLVLISDGACSDESSEGALVAASRGASMPLVIVNASAAPGDVVPLVSEFLSGWQPKTG